MSARDQQVIDKLQTALPLLQLAVRSAERQHADVAAALDALALAVTLLNPPMPPHDNRERQITRLELAITRTSRTIAEVAFLSGLSHRRLQALIAGEPMNTEERQALMKVLPEWRG